MQTQNLASGVDTPAQPDNVDISLTTQENDQLAEQLLQDEKFLNLTIVDLNNREITLKMVQYEMVLELREFLNEHVYTCFFTHYSFEHLGKQLNDYTELAELDLASDPKIYMRAEKYDEKSARQHIRRVKDILSTPPVLTSQVDSGFLTSTAVTTPRAGATLPEQQLSKNTNEPVVEETKNENQEVSKADDAANVAKTESNGNEQVSNVEQIAQDNQQFEQEAKLKKNYEDFLAIIEKESKKEIPMPPKNGVSHLLRDLFTNQIEAEMNQVQQIKCIESIQFSCFNPVPAYRKMVGDLFYLTVKTLDAGEHGITCNVNGFYRNGNVEKLQFNPLPAQIVGKGANACYSYTLVGCLYQISNAFGKNLEQYINSILNTEPYFLTQPALPVHHWIIQQDKHLNSKIVQQAKDQSAELNSTLVPLFGLDPKGIRDWNEEFQVVKDFPKDGFMQRIQRDRAVSKVYNDFLDAATKGAIAIVNGNLMPLNPNEAVKQQVFVYNYIFFSFAVDLIDSFRDLTGSENNPSFTQANHDIMGLRTLQILDIEGLHILATCLVQYKGHRVIAQSIIPGILNNNDLASLAEYGSVDEEKTLYASEHFHGLMKKVCEQLNVQVNKVIDGAGKEVEIAGSVEVKGIKGTDKRSYLVDLQGLTPRDANYKGEDFHTCLLRPELLMIFQRTKNLDYATAKMQEELKKEASETAASPTEEKPSEKVTEGTEEERKEKAAAEREEFIRKKQEENLKKLKDFDRFIKEAPKYTFNTNVLKNVKLALEDEEIAKAETLVEELAKFLKDNAIERLVKDFQNLEGVPTDSESLESTFHQHGVNMRYLGTVANKVKETELNHFKVLLEKEVVFRAVKHIMNEQLRDSSNLYLSSVITHILNLLLAPFPLIELLNEGKITYVDSTVQANLAHDAPRTKENEQANISSEQKHETVNATISDQDSQVKSEKKKNKKKSKQQQKDQPANGSINKQDKQSKQITSTTNSAPLTLNEMLFRPQGASGNGFDVQPFNVNELFSNKEVSQSLLKVEQPKVLSLKPQELYERIKTIAVQRYGYALLPEKQVDLKCIASATNKFALLRDICIKVGIKVISHTNKDYILDNDLKALQTKLAEAQQKQQQAQSQQQQEVKSKKKNNQQQQQQQQLQHQGDIGQNATYSMLPFQIGDIMELFPVVKHLDLQNNDVRSMLQSAKSAYKDSYFEKSFELYSQCINSLLQITGPMNKDVAACISKLASIQFKFGDFLQAIELQTKSIILQERLLGYDHPQTAYSYSNLALYHHTCGYFSKAFEYMYRSLNILKVVCGENHPDISSIYLNLGLMYQDIENFHAAIDCFMESLYRYIALFGEGHVQVARCYQHIAQAYFQLKDFRKALEYQEKAHKILAQSLPADDPNVKDSLAEIDKLMQLSLYVEKFKNADKNQRTIGQNKPVKQGKGQAADALAAKNNAQRLNALFQRLQDPKSRSLLDILEYNHLKQQQTQGVPSNNEQTSEKKEQQTTSTVPPTGKTATGKTAQQQK